MSNPNHRHHTPVRRRLAVPIVLALVVAVGWAPARAVASKAELNADGVIVIDRKKVFPIGFTMPPPPDGKTPDGRNGIDALHEAGATFMRTGVMGGPWDEAAIEREQAWQDAAARNGMHCLVSLRELGSIKEGDEKTRAMLERVVRKFKDHPGMGAWKAVDEPDWNKHPVPPMVNAYRVIKELDPDHPVWVTHAPRGTVESMRRYDAAGDLTGADIYPVGYPPGMHSNLPNKNISLVGDHTNIMRQVAGGKPVWMVLQISWSGVIKPGKTLRFPTFAEERYMTYQAIANGSRGLIYFGGHIPKACTPRDAELGWNWTFWERVLRPVVQEIGEHSPLYPALVAPESKLGVKAEVLKDGEGEVVEFCVREVGDEVFVIACKREGRTVQVRFSGLPAGAGEGEVMFESPRGVKAEGGAFTDWFGPFEVHVYRFAVKK